MTDRPESLIVHSPFESPSRHWVDRGGRLELGEGRRSAG